MAKQPPLGPSVEDTLAQYHLHLGGGNDGALHPLGKDKGTPGMVPWNSLSTIETMAADFIMQACMVSTCMVH